MIEMPATRINQPTTRCHRGRSRNFGLGGVERRLPASEETAARCRSATARFEGVTRPERGDEFFATASWYYASS